MLVRRRDGKNHSAGVAVSSQEIRFLGVLRLLPGRPVIGRKPDLPPRIEATDRSAAMFRAAVVWVNPAQGGYRPNRGVRRPRRSSPIPPPPLPRRPSFRSSPRRSQVVMDVGADPACAPDPPPLPHHGPTGEEIGLEGHGVEPRLVSGGIAAMDGQHGRPTPTCPVASPTRHDAASAPTSGSREGSRSPSARLPPRHRIN